MALQGEQLPEAVEVEIVEVVAVRRRHVLSAIPRFRDGETPLGFRDARVQIAGRLRTFGRCRGREQTLVTNDLDARKQAHRFTRGRVRCEEHGNRAGRHHV